MWIPMPDKLAKPLVARRRPRRTGFGLEWRRSETGNLCIPSRVQDLRTNETRVIKEVLA